MLSQRIPKQVHKSCVKVKNGVTKFECIRALATIVITKQNGFTTSHGNGKIANLGEFLDRFIGMLDGQFAFLEDWVVAEVHVKRGAILIFDQEEDEVIHQIEDINRVGASVQWEPYKTFELLIQCTWNEERRKRYEAALAKMAAESVMVA